MLVEADTKWIRKVTHEKTKYQDVLFEIFYTRIFIFLISILLVSVIFLAFDIFYYIITVSIIFLILFPLFIKPWNIVLTNKRLILRHQYWNIARFSTVISFNLTHLDTQSITPRIKVIPITIGFTLLTSYSLSLLDFYLTKSLPIPLILQMFFIVFGSIGVIKDINTKTIEITNFLFDPFLKDALIFSIISMVVGIALIIFGMPRRTQMVLSTVGGHKLTLNAGVKDKLTTLLFAIGRKHRIVTKSDDLHWDIPLLDDEIIKTKSQVGLIERKSQIIGLLSLFVFLDSLDGINDLISQPTLPNFIILLLKLINLIFIWFAWNFAKKYRRIIATNHRLLYQEERRQISGLWGKRVYVYHDLPYEYIQGFSYSNFSGIQMNSIIGLVIILIGFFAMVNPQNSTPLIILLLLILFFYSTFNYRNYTSLKFFSIGGDVIKLFYRLPVFMVNLSHRLENKDWMYRHIFPNILSEYDVASLCNSIRDVNNPIEAFQSSHEVSVNAFIDRNDKIIAKWDKLTVFRYARGSAFLGGILGIFVAIYFFQSFKTPIKFLFVILSIYLIIGLVLVNLVLRHHSLIILKNRLFHISEILPRRIAQLIGILPERSIDEINLEYLLINRFKLSYNKIKAKQFVKFIVLDIIVVLIFIEYKNLNLSINPQLYDLIIVIFGLLMILLAMKTTRTFFESLPKYSLFMSTRFGEIKVPYIKGMDIFNQSIKTARGL